MIGAECSPFLCGLNLVWLQIAVTHKFKWQVCWICMQPFEGRNMAVFCSWICFHFSILDFKGLSCIAMTSLNGKYIHVIFAQTSVSALKFLLCWFFFPLNNNMLENYTTRFLRLWSILFIAIIWANNSNWPDNFQPCLFVEEFCFSILEHFLEYSILERWQFSNFFIHSPLLLSIFNWFLFWTNIWQ
jgi:hypothetical protein